MEICLATGCHHHWFNLIIEQRISVYYLYNYNALRLVFMRSRFDSGSQSNT